MLASFEGGDRHWGVQEIRQADAHAIDVRVFDQIHGLGVLARCAVEAHDLVTPIWDQVGNRDQLESAGLGVTFCVLIAGPAAANDPGSNGLRHELNVGESQARCQRP